MGIEIERKFLIKESLTDLNEYPGKEILQGYIAILKNGTEVRLRKEEDEYTVTIKSGGDKIRTEIVMIITENEFNSLWPMTEGKRIAKTRYDIQSGDNKVELDIYWGDLLGLMTAEVEFKSEKLSNDFVAPAWFGEEVTEDNRYKNQTLALKGMPR